MKKIFFFFTLIACAGIVHAQQTDKLPVRTSDPGPIHKKATVTVPVSTSSAGAPRAQTFQTAPVRKIDPAGNTKLPSAVSKGQKTGGQTPSATPVSTTGKQQPGTP